MQSKFYVNSLHITKFDTCAYSYRMNIFITRYLLFLLSVSVLL